MRPPFLAAARHARARFALAPLALALAVRTALAAEAPAPTIEASDKAPKAKLATRLLWDPELTVVADASGSTDTDAWPIATYEFDFGDGTPVLMQAQPDAVARHTYARSGKYKIKLVAVDALGKRSSAVSLKVTVDPPPPEKPPVAKLKLSKTSSAPMRVVADGSGSTDADRTPVGSYRFDFGDGTGAVTTLAPVASATHDYGRGGKFTVKLIAIDTGGNESKPVTSSVTITPPPNVAPVARLSLVKPTPTSMTVTADASASTDTDLDPIASYRFDFGDGTRETRLVPEATASHDYAAPGLYTVTLVATDRAGKASKPVTALVEAGVPAPANVAVYAGYYDTHHPGRVQPKPSPWLGSPNVVFVGNPDGSSGGWDSSTLRIDNLGAAPLVDVEVMVEMGTKKFALWGKNTIPPGKTLVLAQTGMENFDGSDTNPAGCYGCSAIDCTRLVMKTVPVVHVTVNGKTTDFTDPNQVLNTRGVDGAGCPPTGTRNDESHPWERLAPKAAGATNALLAGDAPRPAYWLGAPYPNPTRGDIDVQFRIAHSGAVRLAIYDVQGRLYSVPVDEDDMEPGEYHGGIDLARAPAGVYFCVLKSPQGVLKKSFVLAR